MIIMDYEAISGKLEGQYRKIFEEVEAYAILKNYAGEGQEELMMNLLDMLLTAQEEGKEPEKIIGFSVKKFCEDYFTAYDKKAGWMEQLVKTLFLYAWLVGINCIFDFFDDDMNFVGCMAGAKTDLTTIVCCIGVALLTMIALKGIIGFIYRNKSLYSGKLVYIILISSVISAVIGLVVANTCNIILLLPLMPTLVVCIITIVICFTYTGVKNYRRYGSIRKPKEEKESSNKLFYFNYNNDEVSSEYERQLIQGFVDVYNKKNAKLLKKNKPALYPEEFMDFLEKENIKLKKDSRRIPFLWCVICVLTVVLTGMAGGFSSFVDGCLFFVVLALIMFIIYYLIFGKLLFGKILQDRARLFEKCRRNNKTILDYAEEESDNMER